MRRELLVMWCHLELPLVQVWVWRALGEGIWMWVEGKEERGGFWVVARV